MRNALREPRLEPLACGPDGRSPATGTRASRGVHPGSANPNSVDGDAQFLSVKTLAKQWDCSRTTVSRLLGQAGVRAYYFGRGRNGSKRYLKSDVEEFLSRLETT